ncbi:MAG: M20 family metallopeptidase [Brevibacterium sp.]|uniref:M20 metallopeptidase family protein n=1 Tax=Brevibacterium sp. TaxID=1701 RepID=UPI00264707BE|nr:M20 family metallopeptidase [Brevibacterium sp.]MDN5807578.1 M20 family metallopeptidase [Brevibacterium sp.]MDN5833196.1 M20 family metallopeptidase [Brevibacterium sp.]MDN5875710.1 M20 family metallopeptidase [Brevibacterium sp.]MDN5909534.1 M20 family metallopeptidase [Brevibacterium sp.]MDN6122892.1 M20 family metallopeptidase [Brevibacterium sp.]
MSASQTASIPDFRTEAQGLQSDLVALRRTLHANPEIGFDLPFTQKTVVDELADLGLEITTGESLNSVVAVLKGGRPGPAVLLRGDMDALPVVEDTGLDYSSTNGNMHACGHDMHTAGLVGAARLLAAHRDELPGSIVFMFQPAEEVEGGAEPMIAEGVLEAAGVPVIAAYGIHVEADERGKFTTKGGPLMAGFADLNLTIHGAGGHSSQPQATRDPVPAVAEIALALNTMATRSFDIFDPVVVSVTQLEGSQASNIIPDTAKLTASVRYLSADSIALLQERVPEVAENIARAHRCTAEVDFRIGFPVTVNNPVETGVVLDRLGEIFGAEHVEEMAVPRMGSEDFSYVLEKVPGTFVFLGATPEGVDPDAETNHSPRVVFDDGLLGDQAAALAHLAFARLSDEVR